jgi:hypothetical protein
MPSNLMRCFSWHSGKNLLSNNNSCMLFNHHIRKITYHNASKSVRAYHSDTVTDSVYILY